MHRASWLHVERVRADRWLMDVRSLPVAAGRHDVDSARDRCDPVTGLGWTVAFDRRLRELSSARARHAVLAIGVDNPGRVNEQHLRDTAAETENAAETESDDVAMRTVAGAMDAALRLHDCLFRTGRDGFAVVVPVRDEGDALRVAERISRSAERAGHPVSIGVAISEPGEPGADDTALLATAGAALARARSRGRSGTALAHAGHALAGSSAVNARN